MKTEAERSAKIADTRNYIKDLYYKHFRKKKDGSEFGAFKDAVFSPDVSKAALSPFWNAYAAELTQLLMGLKTTSGLSYDDFDAAIGRAKSITFKIIKSLKNGENVTSVFTPATFSKFADMLDESPTYLLFHDYVLPIRLPRKHQLWLKKTGEWTENDLERAYNFMGASNIKLKEPPVTNSGIEQQIANRLRELMESESELLQEMAAKSAPEADWIRKTANKIIRETPTVRFYNLYTLATVLNCSLDYLLEQDYSNYLGEMIDSDGNPIEINDSQRDILGLLLQMNEDDAVQWIGWILAGGAQ